MEKMTTQTMILKHWINSLEEIDAVTEFTKLKKLQQELHTAKAIANCIKQQQQALSNELLALNGFIWKYEEALEKKLEITAEKKIQE